MLVAGRSEAEIPFYAEILDAQYWIPDPGSSKLDVGYRLFSLRLGPNALRLSIDTQTLFSYVDAEDKRQ
jgi:hypothetical protein